MLAGANACIFAAQHQRQVNPMSGAVTLLEAVTLPVIVMVWVATGMRQGSAAHTPSRIARTEKTTCPISKPG